MAINKTINKSTKSHGAMRNCIEYVLNEAKIKDGYVAVIGPYAPEVIDWDHVYNAFLEEKRLWGKDSGRMYSHNIISFHKDEKISPEEAFRFAKEFAEQWFPNHQSLISVHQDRDHIHAHIVTNTVSFVDGMKLHNSKADLQRMKDFTNEMCREHGLTIAEKGHHFDGSIREDGEITAWSKDKYHLIIDDKKKSYLVECATAVLEARDRSVNKDEFVREMSERGWSVLWSDTRKHITFQNADGKKVRDTNISKTFALDISKEALTYEFARQNELRAARVRNTRERQLEEQQLAKYYSEVESAVTDGTDPEAIGNDKQPEGSTISRTGNAQVRTRESGQDDTESFLRDLDAEENRAAEKRDDSELERQTREAERLRLAAERSRSEREAERLHQKRSRRYQGPSL